MLSFFLCFGFALVKYANEVKTMTRENERPLYESV